MRREQEPLGSILAQNKAATGGSNSVAAIFLSGPSIGFFSDAWIFGFSGIFGSVGFSRIWDGLVSGSRMLVFQDLGCWFFRIFWIVGFSRIFWCFRFFRMLDVRVFQGFGFVFLRIWDWWFFKDLGCFRLLIQRCKRKGVGGNFFD